MSLSLAKAKYLYVAPELEYLVIDLPKFRVQQHNGIDFLNMLIGKEALIPHLGIPAQHQVAGAAGAPLVWEHIPDTLGLDIR